MLPVVITAITLVFLFFTGRSLGAYYWEPKYARDDYRGVVAHIQENRQANDGIILVAPGQAEIFGYYARRTSPEMAVYPLPQQRPINTEQTTGDLKQIMSNHKRVWLVLWAAEEADPAGLVSGWLDANGGIAGSREFGTIRVSLYTLDSGR